MIPLGYGKFVRADRVYALVPLEAASAATAAGRSSMSRDRPPIVASRSELAIARDLAVALGHAAHGRAMTTRGCRGRRRSSDRAPQIVLLRESTRLSNRIGMADLRARFADAGLEDPRTYCRVATSSSSDDQPEALAERASS